MGGIDWKSIAVSLKAQHDGPPESVEDLKAVEEFLMPSSEQRIAKLTPTLESELDALSRKLTKEGIVHVMFTLDDPESERTTSWGHSNLRCDKLFMRHMLHNCKKREASGSDD